MLIGRGFSTHRAWCSHAGSWFAFPFRGFLFGNFGWFGTRAQVVGLVTVFLLMATLIVFGRLYFIGREEEEMAADLGASPTEIVRRVLLPQLRTDDGQRSRWYSRQRWESSSS